MQTSQFEWDDDKARANFDKHGVKFQTAMKVFSDENRFTFSDDEHSITEDRYVTIGMANDVLYVVWTERHPKIRIISARKAEKHERRLYYDRYLHS